MTAFFMTTRSGFCAKSRTKGLSDAEMTRAQSNLGVAAAEARDLPPEHVHTMDSSFLVVLTISAGLRR